MIQTVRGPIAVEDLGPCLPHEHVLLDWWSGDDANSSLDGILNDEQRQIAELTSLADFGVRSLVDLTVSGIGQNPEGLRRIAEALDLHIVMGAGWYRQPYYGQEIDRTPTSELARQLVRFIRQGSAGTGIRPGIIGEIGSHKDYVTAQEERVFRAAGKAAVETGLAVTTHSVASDVGLRHLELLTEEGVPADRIVIGHADTFLDQDYLHAIVGSGAFVEFDNIGYVMPVVASLEKDLIPTIVNLIEAGYVEQILLSQDVCARSHLVAYGGNGYTYLFSIFRERLIHAGVTADQWSQMTTTNPARVLEIR